MTFAGRALTGGLFHLVAMGHHIGTSPITVWTKPTTRFPPVLPDAHVSPLQVTAAVPSAEGGHTPEPQDGRLRVPHHFHTCIRTRCGVSVALLHPDGHHEAPLTRRSSPLTFVGRGLTNRLLHLVVIGRPIGTLHNRVRAQPTTGSPPCRPDAAVSPLQVPAAAPSMKGVTLRSRVPGVCTCHHTSRHVRGPSDRFGGIASPEGPRAHT